MKKQSLKEFSDRRKSKFLNMPTIITNEYIMSLVGNSSFDNWGFSYLDLSNCDLSKVDLKIMTKVAFSSSTIWPNADKMPHGFYPEEILSNCTKISNDFRLLH